MRPAGPGWATPAACVCESASRDGGAHFVAWASDLMKMCVYSTQDVLAFGLGLATITFWLGSQLPQAPRN